VTIRNSDDHLPTAVPRMKMSWFVLAMIHRNDYPEETADLGHAVILSPPAIISST
jgi:hypothetical protein